MAESNLLGYLAIYCRVDYLSDLSLTPRCKEIISRTSDEMFSLDEWNEAIHYLCKENNVSFATVKSAKEYLLKH